MSPSVAPAEKPALWPVDMPLQPRPCGPLWIGVAGKGGSGKSVLSGTLARVLARRGHSVLAIDSDPMPGLAHSLGVDEPAAPLLLGAAQKPEKGPWKLRDGIGPELVVREHTTPAPDGVRMLQLGKAGSKGLAAAGVFLEVVRRLHEAPALRDWVIVGDLPAGPRHLGAGFSPYAGLYVVVVEPTSQSALTARRVGRLARGPLGADVIFVASKVAGAAERERVQRLLGEPVDFEIPADPAVADAERRHVAVLDDAPDSPVVAAIGRLADTIEQRSVQEET